MNTEQIAQDRSACERADTASPLAGNASRFHLPQACAYFGGNSLGPAPTAAEHALSRPHTQWCADGVAGWGKHDWRDEPARVGDAIGEIIGAGAGQTLAVDTTAINLYKVLHVALGLAGEHRRVILTERSNFPADLHIMASLAKDYGAQVVHGTADTLAELVREHADSLAVLCLADVNYRDGTRHDITALTEAAHAVGALAVWDLAHSGGAVDVDIEATGADFAVGCGYKFFNGGPGAPAYVWTHPRHLAVIANPDHPWQPLWGWLGHADPFAFKHTFAPSTGAMHWLTSSPSQHGLALVAAGVAEHQRVAAMCGLNVLWQTGQQLWDLFAALIDARCEGLLEVATPRAPEARGSQLSLRLHDELANHGAGLAAALGRRGVVCDFRVGEITATYALPDYLRFGITPLYLARTDIYDAVEQLVAVIAGGEFRTEQNAGDIR